MEWLSFDRLINTRLLFEPMNWAILFVFASIWLLAGHVLMQGWSAMASGAQPAIGAAPGQVATGGGQTSVFSGPGILSSLAPANLDQFQGAGSSPWTDGGEARWGEDGYSIY